MCSPHFSIQMICVRWMQTICMKERTCFNTSLSNRKYGNILTRATQSTIYSSIKLLKYWSRNKSAGPMNAVSCRCISLLVICATYKKKKAVLKKPNLTQCFQWINTNTTMSYVKFSRRACTGGSENHFSLIWDKETIVKHFSAQKCKVN